MAEKIFKFINAASYRAYKALPPEIQKQFGHDLNAVQQGMSPFSVCDNVAESVGPGAIELKENGSPAYRAVFCAKYLDTVYILHAFAKTKNGHDSVAMAVARTRHKLMMQEVEASKAIAKKAAKTALKKAGR